MKGPKRPSANARSRSSGLTYQTLSDAKASSGRGPPQPPQHDPPSGARARSVSSRDGSEDKHHSHESPLPKKQLAILAVIALAEQTALNSISPYLPEMASTFPEVESSQVGLYVGLIASSFALAQFATNFFWGWLSDKIGRKPVILTGTLLTAACFIAFGFCRTLWQAMLVQMFMGLVNGNQGVVSTCLGEITDRSNQSRAFTYLPVVYGIGGITGPVIGGLLVFEDIPFRKGKRNPYPYLGPNLFSAFVLVVDLVLTMFMLEESLEEAKDLPPLGKRIENLFTWIWQLMSAARSTYIRRIAREANVFNQHHHYPETEDDMEGRSQASDQDSETGSQTSFPAVLPHISSENLSRKEVFNRDTILLLVTFLIFQLANISYNSLYPIFAHAQPPTGRDLNPKEIGLSLGFAGVITIIFQVGIYGKLRDKIGNKITYRISLAAFVVAFFMMPFVGYKEGKGPFGIGRGEISLWIELGFVLLVKTVAAVGGLTSALLLITNSAPNHSVLGTLNGLAQTLSAAGRAAGPLVSGSLFSASTHLRPKGEALAFGIFGGISFLGFLLSLGIRGQGLEAEGFDEEEAGATDDDDDNDSDDDDEEDTTGERRPLLRGST